MVIVQTFASYRFTFDRIYSPECSQEDIYTNTARDAVLSTLQVPPPPSYVLVVI